MKILIVGNGGREHALLWKLMHDAPEASFYATRPNGGMAPHCEPVEIAPGDVEALAGWATAHQIDLTIVGPEVPLAKGLANRFRRSGLAVFGPSAEAARIESSKSYAKELMVRQGVPTADYRMFTNLEGALAYIEERGGPLVVKASGLAAGKGAIVCETTEEAADAATGMLGDFSFGEAGREVVIEEFMEGEELSLFAVCDGTHAVALLPSQDHKRVGEGDVGPNTGGMGAYAPVSIATPELISQVMHTIVEPTLAGLAEDGASFSGLLYAGLMLTAEGPKVVEFNCRFGDPETQVVLPMMNSSLLDLLVPVSLGGSIRGGTVDWRAGAAATTVLASGGYPGPYEKGKTISIPTDVDERDDVLVFHAGTTLGADGLESSGGRVLAVTGLGSDLDAAAEASRSGAEAVSFDGKYFRRDIAWRELARG